jgi:hypothetical protein
VGVFLFGAGMKYQVMKRCVINGSTWNVGDIVETGKDFAEEDVKGLMGIGRIIPADETKIEDRAIGLDEEPMPKRAPKTRRRAE